MNNINKYRNRFMNLLESTIGDVRPLINEQQKKEFSNQKAQLNPQGSVAKYAYYTLGQYEIGLEEPRDPNNTMIEPKIVVNNNNGDTISIYDALNPQTGLPGLKEIKPLMRYFQNRPKDVDTALNQIVAAVRAYPMLVPKK